jgi:hypothetical protein
MIELRFIKFSLSIIAIETLADAREITSSLIERA